MQLQIYKDYQTLSSHVASNIIDLVKKKPNAVLCLASGHTPVLTYSIVAERAASENIDFGHCTFIGLDEWMGIPPNVEGSCHFFLQKNIFGPLNISSSQYHLFDALAVDPQKECYKMDKIISEKGGIDLMLLGVGMNGHIGFNEPGVSFDNCSHLVQLDDTTLSVGQKYFANETALGKGLTLGVKTVTDTNKVILMATGVKKAEVMKKVLEGEVSNTVPASIIRNHRNSFVMIDDDAASSLMHAYISR
jgi:glucosamine-6-phosphate isomerase